MTFWHLVFSFRIKTFPFFSPQGSVAKGGRIYSVKRLCENTRETNRTPTHTHQHTHAHTRTHTHAHKHTHTQFAQAYTEKSRQSFSAVLTPTIPCVSLPAQSAALHLKPPAPKSLNSRPHSKHLHPSWAQTPRRRRAAFPLRLRMTKKSSCGDLSSKRMTRTTL